MSMEQLEADLGDNVATVKRMDPATTTTADLVKHLKLTLYPFLEAMISEMNEMDGCIADLVEGAEDILTHETGQKLAGVIAGATLLVLELEKLAGGDPARKKAIDEWKTLAAECAQIITEITLDETADEDDEDDDNDDAEGDAE